MINWIKKSFRSIDGYVEKQLVDLLLYFSFGFILVFTVSFFIENIINVYNFSVAITLIYAMFAFVYSMVKVVRTIYKKKKNAFLIYQFISNFKGKYYNIYVESLLTLIFLMYTMATIMVANRNLFGIVFIGAILAKIYISILINNLGKILLNKKVEAMYSGKDIDVFIDDEIYKDSVYLINHLHDSVINTMQDKINSEKMKTELITNISHDIKTPLTSIINYVDLLNHETDESEKKRYIEILEYNAKRLKTMVIDLIYASKTGTGNIDIEMEVVELNELVLQVYGQFDSDFNKMGLEFEYNDKRKTVLMMTDGAKLSRVIENIFSNIVKYSKPNTKVYGECDVVNDNIILKFSNISKNKIEVSAEDLMGQFVRGERSRHSEGSGLGLYIAKNLIELLGGTSKISIDEDRFVYEINFKVTRKKKIDK